MRVWTAPTRTVLVGRYVLMGQPDIASLNEVLIADDQQDGERVVIKAARLDCPAPEHIQQCWDLAHEGAMLQLLARTGFPAPQYRELLHTNDRSHLVMSFIPGRTLAQLARRGGLNTAAALRVLAEIAGLLAALHRLGFVHHDVKPSNLLLTRSGRALLLDWGSAQRIRTVVGPQPWATLTPAYAPLEQLRGAISPANDVYALGRCIEDLVPRQGWRLKQIIRRCASASRDTYSAGELYRDLWWLGG